MGPSRLPTLGSAGPARVRWIERLPARLALEVESSSPGILVLSEIYHPYWSAAVDGRPVDLLQVDVALRGIPIGAGRQRVTMEFRDPMLATGRWGSVAGLLLLAGAFVATRRRRPSKAEETR